MSLTRLAITRQRVTAVALVCLATAAVLTYPTMPRSEDPGFTMRAAQVVTLFPGASPDRVESLVSEKIEEAVREIPELDFVTAESRTGVSVVIVNIQERYTNMRPIWDSLRRKVERVRPDLPEGVIGPRVNDEFGDVFGVILGVTGEGFTYAELEDVAEQVRDQLLRLPDAAKVEIYGAQEERVFVEFNNARLTQLGVSPFHLMQIIATQNVIIPGGEITADDERIALEPTGNFQSVGELRRTVVRLPGDEQVAYLEDLATVTRGYVDPPRNRVRSGTAAALALGVSLRKGGNIIDLGAAVDGAIARLQEQYPIGIEFEKIADQPAEVARKVFQFESTLGQAILLVLAVMLLTLGLRTGMLVASLIPMTILVTLLLMGVFDIGLDQVSLASLIIALGMLVDNAIVMSESIMVQMSRGKKPIEAAVDSAKELRIPLLTSSLTTAAAFLPIFLAQSNVGEYTRSIFKVVTIALLSSWVLALTMTPMLCTYFMKVKEKARASNLGTWVYGRYQALLLAALRRRWTTLGVTLAVFFAAMAGFAAVPKIFFPETDYAFFTARLEMPTGTPIERAEEVLVDIEEFIEKELKAGPDRPQGITTWASFIGGGEPKFRLSYNPRVASPGYVLMIINTTSTEIIDGIAARLERFAYQAHPDLEPTIKRLSNGPPVEYPIAIRLSGPERSKLFAIVDRVKAKLRETPGAKNIRDDWGPRAKKLLVSVNQARARRARVTSQDVAVSLQAALSGIVSTQYREGDKIIPVTLRSSEADRDDIGKIELLNVYSMATGRAVPLKQVADVSLQWEPSKTRRRNGVTTVTVTSELEEGVNALETIAGLAPWFDEQSARWGLGYAYEFGGELESSGKANASINEQLPVAGLIILLLLVGQFNSLRRAFIVSMAIPLGLVGVSLGLNVARSYFGFMTFLGVISLAGIVVNNAIVLLDRIRIEHEVNGLAPQRAVVEAARLRLRPILLTTATTVGGLIPLWTGGGAMFEPMAIAIIFGLLISTVMTLVVVPVLYALMFRVSYRGYSHAA